MVQWDPSDDQPTPQLLSTAGWGPELVERCRQAFEEVLSHRPPGAAQYEDSVVALLEAVGVQPQSQAQRCARAIMRSGPQSISFDELLILIVRCVLVLGSFSFVMCLFLVYVCCFCRASDSF